jgi:two-component system nitrate/nitrite response regulator NarL
MWVDMESNLATVVVEARSLVREALKSLMAKNSYLVVCDVGSSAEISAAAVSDEPKLAILGAQSSDNAIAEADAIRRLWPNSKIVLLYEQTCLADLRKLQTSQIDGCVPLFASSDTLIGMLNLVMDKGARVMMIPGAESPVIQPAQPEKSHPSEIVMSGCEWHAGEPEAILVTMEDAQPAANGASVSGLERSTGGTLRVPPLGSLPKLSAREVQIMNGIVKGHANKVIARTCDIAEATVKVHMKSILRKIRVTNRTQAAIWALESGYPAA